ncbi:uncharacterized protein LOC102720548 [Oryza brachyantha]|uniref:At1g61320/AtMIF1 LRR domain-containing protein n=1 Tax=Oryza brachyantha TaxID=4533 RepID=J3MYY0_ORYBR|nr:uncharacterized protein LOC102720548 [Oryza brachyantha]
MASAPTTDGPIDSVAKRKGSPCQQDGDFQDDKRPRSSVNLPEGIFWYIHSLMPLRDAARAACVSHSFLRSWRCYPYLLFNEEIVLLDKNTFGNDETTRNLTSKVNHILQNHSGIGVKKLEFVFFSCTSVDFSYLDSWLHKAVTSGIEEVTLMLPTNSNAGYNFPCSVLSDGNGNSIQYIYLSHCAIRPTVDLGCLRTLTNLHLCSVRITGCELECLLSKSPALELLKVMSCKEIVQLKIPCLLKRLHTLYVNGCEMLKVVESYAPNLTTFDFTGHAVQMLGLLQMKNFDMLMQTQIVSTQTVLGKFLSLKHLHISLNKPPNYDYVSLVYFLDAAPSLETFILLTPYIHLPQGHMGYAWTAGDSAQLRQMPEHRHDNLKKFEVSGFCYVKSLVELICHILETTSSLNHVKLDTSYRSGCHASGRCYPYGTEQMREACNAVLAIKTCIIGKVPPKVELDLVQPCSRCRALVQ